MRTHLKEFVPLFVACLLFAPKIAHPHDVNQLPEKCSSSSAKSDMYNFIPQLLGLSNEAAHIKDVQIIGDMHQIPQADGTPMLPCNIKVSWTNGLIQFGTFKEWINEYGQAEVGYGVTSSYKMP